MPITHAFVSAVADGADATLVQPGDWNAVHVGDPYLTSGPRAIPEVTKRMPSGVYRVAQAEAATSFATKRVLGMWVPSYAFGRGTIIKFKGASSTASPIFKLGIGGQASAISLGVQLTWTTGPAAACGFELTATQRADGVVGPTFDSGGYFAGATSLVVTTGTFLPFIQPLNYVEVVTSGTFTLFGCSLELVPPQWHFRSNAEMFDV